jgi:hypothetical protein
LWELLNSIKRDEFAGGNRGLGQHQLLADKIIGGSGAEIKDCCGRIFYRRQIGSGDQADPVDPGCPRIAPCLSASVSSRSEKRRM